VLPISGWLSGIVGRKRFFLICIISFTICSVLCGLATNLAELVVFRILQGLFGGGLQPSQQAILLDTFPPAQRARAFSIVAIATVVAPVLGPSLGGWITDSYSWRWIFFVNLPVGVIAAFFVMQVVEDPPHARADPSRVKHIDFPGLGLIALGFGALQIVMDRGEIDDWFGSGFIRISALLAFLGIGGAIGWLLIARNPVVDLGVFRNRNFAVGCLLMFIFAGILYGSAVLVPQLVQQRFNYTSKLAGLVLSPAALVTAFLLPGVAQMMKRIQPRYMIMMGFAVIAIGCLYSSRFSPDVNFGWLVRARIAVTIGIAFLFAPISVATTGTLRPEQNAAGASLFVMARNIGGSVGISFVTTMLARRAQVHQSNLTARLSSGNGQFQAALSNIAHMLITRGSSPAEAARQAYGMMAFNLDRQATMLAYIDNFWILGCCVAAMIPFVFLMKKVKHGGSMAVH
jgi:MFS transporter, DHA2 family, multidrug resistance protein